MNSGRRRAWTSAMFRKLSIALLLTSAAGNAHLLVRIGPPPVVVETPVPAPGPGYVWTPGYYSWNGQAYVWVPGVWVVAPFPGARWVPPRWVHRHGGWGFIGGRWV